MLIQKQFSKYNFLENFKKLMMFMTIPNSSQGYVAVLPGMVNYEKTKVKLTNSHLNKLESAAKNNSGTTLRLRKKKCQDE